MHMAAGYANAQTLKVLVGAGDAAGSYMRGGSEARALALARARALQARSQRIARARGAALPGPPQKTGGGLRRRSLGRGERRGGHTTCLARCRLRKGRVASGADASAAHPARRPRPPYRHRPPRRPAAQAPTRPSPATRRARPWRWSRRLASTSTSRRGAPPPPPALALWRDSTQASSPPPPRRRPAAAPPPLRRRSAPPLSCVHFPTRGTAAGVEEPQEIEEPARAPQEEGAGRQPEATESLPPLAHPQGYPY